MLLQISRSKSVEHSANGPQNGTMRNQFSQKTEDMAIYNSILIYNYWACKGMAPISLERIVSERGHTGGVTRRSINGQTKLNAVPLKSVI